MVIHADKQLVNLNVDGKKYTTAMETVLKCDKLSKIVQEDSFDGFITEQDEVFVDRDGEAFRYTLHYLRTGDTDLCSNDQLKMLRSEAKFYELGMLEVKIDKMLADLEERNDQLGALEKKMDEMLAETEARYYQFDALGKEIAEILTEKKSAKKVYRLVEKDELDNLFSLNPEVTTQATSLSSMKKKL